jgi:hypothetical protein
MMAESAMSGELTPIEYAMLWERMSGERLSDVERQRIMDGGNFVPPTTQRMPRQITTIRDPGEDMEPAMRAEQMWRVHPNDLDRLRMTRQEFYKAHIDAAIAYAVKEISHD